jgi:hypothetical protein
MRIILAAIALAVLCVSALAGDLKYDRTEVRKAEMLNNLVGEARVMAEDELRRIPGLTRPWPMSSNRRFRAGRSIVPPERPPSS